MNNVRDFDKTLDELNRGIRKAEYHKRQCKNYDRIVETTKNRGGLFRVIHDFAVKKAAEHWVTGFKKILICWTLTEKLKN